ALAQQGVDEGHEVLRARAVRKAGAEQAVLYTLCRRRGLALPVEEGAAATPGGIKLVDVGVIDDADFDLAVPHQGDRNAPGRHAAEEAGSAVDRIDHPDRLSRLAALAGASLLTQETVFWKTLLQLAADQLLDFLIGDRDNVLQPLA